MKVFQLDPAGGAGGRRGRRTSPRPPGCGPRHIAFAPDGKFAYVCGELDSTVNVIELGKGGKVVQSLSTLPDAGEGQLDGRVHPVARREVRVRLEPRAQQHRGVQGRSDDRKLTAAGHITGDIKMPRNFNIDPSGKWMLIASQDGGKVGRVGTRPGDRRRQGDGQHGGGEPVRVREVRARRRSEIDRVAATHESTERSAGGKSARLRSKTRARRLRVYFSDLDPNVAVAHATPWSWNPMCPSRLKSFSAVLNLFLRAVRVLAALGPLVQVHLVHLLAVDLDRQSCSPFAVIVILFQSSFFVFSLVGATRS